MYGPVPQGHDPYAARVRYRANFEKALKESLQVVPWQEKPPETPSVRDLSSLLDQMPFVEDMEARDRTSRRRAINRDEFALLNWWYFSGATSDGLRRRLNGEPVTVPRDPLVARD